MKLTGVVDRKYEEVQLKRGIRDGENRGGQGWRGKLPAGLLLIGLASDLHTQSPNPPG